MCAAGRSLVAEAEALAAAGRVGDAFRLLSGATGDPQALFALAQWRLSGAVIRRDLAEARALFGRAAELGHGEAERIHVAMLANGAGSEPRWCDALDRLEQLARRDPSAARERALIAGMDLDEDGAPRTIPAAEPVSAAPEVKLLRGFLSPAECAFLIEAARPRLQPSVVVHPTTGQLIRDPVRTSAAAAFPFVLESPAIHAINRRIAAATATAAEQGEPVQVLRYTPGQEYKPHSDALPGGGGNQRVLTFLVWLNDGYEGGETVFTATDLKLKGRAGDGLLFRNVTAGGAPDPLARHAGLPVTRGEKLLLSRWIRERPLDLSGPPGRPH